MAVIGKPKVTSKGLSVQKTNAVLVTRKITVYPPPLPPRIPVKYVESVVYLQRLPRKGVSCKNRAFFFKLAGNSGEKFVYLWRIISTRSVYQRVNKPPAGRSRALERTQADAWSSVSIVSWIVPERL
jgi:hypothetical protein